MRTAKVIIAALIMGACLTPGTSQADPKPWIWSWWESHWENQDFEPYLENATDPHNSQWDHVRWSPEDWASQRANEMTVIRGFYKADILRGQHMDDDVPVLVVGPRFYMLGGHDKRRVMKMVDYAYGVTNSKENGMFMIHDWKSRDAVGAYTRYGLQIQ